MALYGGGGLSSLRFGWLPPDWQTIENRKCGDKCVTYQKGCVGEEYGAEDEETHEVREQPLGENPNDQKQGRKLPVKAGQRTHWQAPGSIHQQTLDPLPESTAVLHRACSDP